jgi:hypothetical protein
MTMTLDQALALCEHASPMPHLAGQALRVMRDEIARLNELADRFSAAINEMTGPTFMGEPVLPHPDNTAVDAFAVAMKAKLAEARAKGRGGWQDKDDFPQQRLSDMLRAHLAKGDPRDVANFCMFLHQRGEAILPADPVAQSEAVAWQQKRRPSDYPDEWRECSKEVFDMISRTPDSPWVARELFDHPPAQAAQLWEMKHRACRAHALCNELRLANPEIPELGDDGALHEAIHDILRVDTPTAEPVEQQATTCAGCGKHKPTPLRIDAMGGYVCLTCIDEKLSSLLGEFGYPEPAGRQGEAVAIGFRHRMKGSGPHWSYNYHRAPDSFELRECDIETVWAGNTHSAVPVGVPDGWRDVASDALKVIEDVAQFNGGLPVGIYRRVQESLSAMLAAAPSPGEPKSCDRNCDCVGPCKMGGE